MPTGAVVFKLSIVKCLLMNNLQLISLSQMIYDHLACYDCLYFVRLVLFTNVCLALSVLWVLARGNGVVVNTVTQYRNCASV